MITEVDQVLSEALSYTRPLVAELIPPVLRNRGLAAALTWLGQYMKKHGMEVSVSVPFDHESIPEDQAILLFQSVRELLINAWKHSGMTTASVVMLRQADALSIEVRDNGRGFDPAVLPDKDVSSGFGLFSIRERMKCLGGSFEIHSAAETGSACVLVLPVPQRIQERPGEITTPAAEMVFNKHSAPGKTVSVLLVDDHAMMRQGLNSVLSSYADVEVVMEAADGIEAIEAVERCHPSVVIMDINLPRMNGIEATARIKQRYPSLPIIGLSVNAGEGNQEAMAKAGAEILLTKEGAVETIVRGYTGPVHKGTNRAS